MLGAERSGAERSGADGGHRTRNLRLTKAAFFLLNFVSVVAPVGVEPTLQV
jgi:hypothetical protein